MKHVIMVLMGAVLIFNSGLVFAEKNDSYFRISGLIGDMGEQDLEGRNLNASGKFKMDSGFGLSAAIGHRINKNVRAEIEYTYREASFQKGEFSYDNDEGKNLERITNTANDKDISQNMSNKTIMLNGLFDLDNSSIATPYAGAGIGFTWFQGIDSADKAEFGYQVLAGVNVEVTKHIGVMLGYRFHQTSDWEYDGLSPIDNSTDVGKITGSYSSHNFELGATLHF